MDSTAQDYILNCVLFQLLSTILPRLSTEYWLLYGFIVAQCIFPCPWQCCNQSDWSLARSIISLTDLSKRFISEIVDLQLTNQMTICYNYILIKCGRQPNTRTDAQGVYRHTKVQKRNCRPLLCIKVYVYHSHLQPYIKCP